MKHIGGAQTYIAQTLAAEHRVRIRAVFGSQRYGSHRRIGFGWGRSGSVSAAVPGVSAFRSAGPEHAGAS